MSRHLCMEMSRHAPVRRCPNTPLSGNVPTRPCLEMSRLAPLPGDVLTRYSVWGCSSGCAYINPVAYSSSVGIPPRSDMFGSSSGRIPPQPSSLHLLGETPPRPSVLDRSSGRTSTSTQSSAALELGPVVPLCSGPFFWPYFHVNPAVCSSLLRSRRAPLFWTVLLALPPRQPSRLQLLS